MGIGFLEIVLILLVALVVINPKEYPKIAYSIGVIMQKISNTVANIKNKFLNGDIL